MSKIQAATIERVDGYWTHPDFPEWHEGTKKAECDAWAADNDGEFVAVWFEWDAPDSLIDSYFEQGETDISDWFPVCEKAGSFLLSIHDTENGPIALFFAPNNGGEI